MKRIQLTSFNISDERNDSGNNVHFTEKSKCEPNRKSIVLLLRSGWLNYVQQNFSPILKVISFFALIFGCTHTVLMLASVFPLMDASPIIPGNIFIIISTLVMDFSMMGVMYLSFIHKIDFSEFEMKSEALGFDYNHPIMVNILKKARRKVTIIGLVFTSSWLLNVFVVSMLVYMNDSPHGSTVATIEAIHVANCVMIPLLPSHKIFTLFTSALFLRSVFSILNQRLVDSSSQWTFADLRFYREMYSKAIDLTKSVNEIWQNFLVIFYPSVNGFILFFIFYTVNGPLTLFRYSCFGLLSVTFILLFACTNKFITGVNIEAFSIHDTVYIISLNSKDATFMEEANLFLKRIGRHDVGFSYKTLIVYSPRLVGSVLTLLTTIMIAFPTFIKYKW